MYPIIISLIILFAFLLVLVILAQNSKGGGLTSQFGGSSASNIIGVKKTGDLLEKLTWGFIVGIMVLSLATNFVTPGQSSSTNDILDRAGQQAPATQQAPALNLDSTGSTPADTTPN
ncbi:preprotein translocase subunit SecG [Chryseolinea lacunae]|uniref:Protein-export membrane protein SecG n=1 Tax=Chryseolinea lacunae TaxID=2801331 RepID=A0ABS1KY22_9BACT|nr:preprotein translocase subunit SecG [Chryseolinea lacunae]MBL0744289.1 preprotein translocase subunit SecG [Chryseolinea lacunae]